MHAEPIGQILFRMGKISTIDIDEILEQQDRSGGQFGQIAMSWGLCEAVDVCEAWCIQFAEGFEWPDLSHCQIDAKVILAVPEKLARELHILPLVSIADQMVVAASHPVDGAEWMQILEATGKDVRFILAEQGAIDEALEVYYPKAA